MCSFPCDRPEVTGSASIAVHVLPVAAVWVISGASDSCQMSSASDALVPGAACSSLLERRRLSSESCLENEQCNQKA